MKPPPFATVLSLKFFVLSKLINVLSNAAETRATPTTPSNLTSTDFDVFAFTADGTAFMGKADTEFGHDGVNIVYKDNKWDYKNANDLRYWPSEALDFYAFNPGTVSEDMMAFYSWEATKDVQKISYTCMDGYSRSKQPIDLRQSAPRH